MARIGTCKLCDRRGEVLHGNGLCYPCYAFDRYHAKRRHGPAYFAGRTTQVKRWVKRYERLGAAVRPLRAVAGGGGRT